MQRTFDNETPLAYIVARADAHTTAEELDKPDP